MQNTIIVDKDRFETLLDRELELASVYQVLRVYDLDFFIQDYAAEIFKQKKKEKKEYD